MIPLLSVAQMRRFEAPFLARAPDALVEKAGTKVAHIAREMLGTCYAKRVAVLVPTGVQWSRRASRGSLAEISRCPG